VLIFGLSVNRSGLFLLVLALQFPKTFSCCLVNAYVLFIFSRGIGGHVQQKNNCLSLSLLLLRLMG
jgi:hypothetical protein